jgi:ABC-type dipeptide/oligopeptide/nickel transport system ATPase component
MATTRVNPPQRRQLDLRSVSVSYSMSGRAVPVVREMSLSLSAGETLGIVGTTGSGKSTLGLSILRLLPPGARMSGSILLGDEDLVTCSDARMREIRGGSIGMIFQDSLASLNPVLTVRSQLAETLRRHDKTLSRAAAKNRADEALVELGIPPNRLRGYPHEFSGGMRQRAMIAIALAADPTFLIADESTAELDAPTQLRILDLLAGLQAERGIGLMVISHDLAIINRMCKRVAVISKGTLVEHGPSSEVLSNPESDYTRGLVRMSAKTMTADGRLYTHRQVEA